MAKKTGTVKKKVVKVGALGNAYVHSTFNNVIITITNEVGNPSCRASAWTYQNNGIPRIPDWR